MYLPPRDFNISLNVIIGEVYHNMVLENVYILSISCSLYIKSFLQKFPHHFWTKYVATLLLYPSIALFAWRLRASNFPVDIPYSVIPHVSFLYKLWILFSYISYVNWHPSRILTTRILNKILRNLLPFFNHGKGPTRLLFYLLW